MRVMLLVIGLVMIYLGTTNKASAVSQILINDTRSSAANGAKKNAR